MPNNEGEKIFGNLVARDAAAALLIGYRNANDAACARLCQLETRLIKPPGKRIIFDRRYKRHFATQVSQAIQFVTTSEFQKHPYELALSRATQNGWKLALPVLNQLALAGCMTVNLTNSFPAIPRNLTGHSRAV